jgi:hypothetical protein
MAHTEPDIAELFAPLRPAQAFSVVLSEAQQVLAHIQQPVDAELWGSDMIGALGASAAQGSNGTGSDGTGSGGTGSGGTGSGGTGSGGTGSGGTGSDGTDVMTEIAAALVPAAEERATPESLALLRIFATIGSAELRASASQAAARLSDSGIPDASWAAQVGSPEIGRCWHFSDIGGRQESLTLSFSYGAAEHALSVLIDHTKGGRIKDAWVDDAEGLLDKTWLTAEHDPLVVFETIEPADARVRLEQAVAAGECPAKPDEVDDLTGHRALLLARLRLLATATA